MRCVIEVPRGGRVKWAARGGVDYVSVVPSPFNYGSAPDYPAEDGDPADVVVLGATLPRGHEVELPVRGRVRFVDAGVRDDKWICGEVGPGDIVRLRRFFAFYAAVKRVLNRARRRGGPTRFEGVEHW